MTSQAPKAERLRALVQENRPNLEPYADLYRKLHQNPELPGMEVETAKLVAEHLDHLGFDVHTGVGGHGVVGVYREGAGETIVMRAAMDAQPILEQTNVPYTSQKRMIDQNGNEKPVMHANGHDMDMATLLAAGALLHKSMTSGTLVVIFQPGAGKISGAQSMIDDGLFNLIPLPDIMLAQHVGHRKLGTVELNNSGPVYGAVDSVKIRIFGGDDSENPLRCSPVPIAIDIVQDLSTDTYSWLVEDEDEVVRLSCESINSSTDTTSNYPFVDILLIITTEKADTRREILKHIQRCVRDKCEELWTEPEYTFDVKAPLVINDSRSAETVVQPFLAHFGQSFSTETKFNKEVNDFSTFAARHEVPYLCWTFGGTAIYHRDGAKNGSPHFAPVIDPTLQTGTDAMALAALSFLID